MFTYQGEGYGISSWQMGRWVMRPGSQINMRQYQESVDHSVRECHASENSMCHLCSSPTWADSASVVYGASQVSSERNPSCPVHAYPMFMPVSMQPCPLTLCTDVSYATPCHVMPYARPDQTRPESRCPEPRCPFQAPATRKKERKRK